MLNRNVFFLSFRLEKPTEQGAAEAVTTANIDAEALSSECSNNTEDVHPEGKKEITRKLPKRVQAVFKNKSFQTKY